MKESNFRSLVNLNQGLNQVSLSNWLGLYTGYKIKYTLSSSCCALITSPNTWSIEGTQHSCAAPNAAHRPVVLSPENLLEMQNLRLTQSPESEVAL